MFNLLIVDDEPFIVEGLAALNWETVGINQVFKATSGTDAIKSIEDNQVDIVITDIKMPDISGIELIKQNELGRNKKCILLSGYADFEYAKQAIKYDAFEYLLKPASDDEIYQAVQNAIDELNKEEKRGTTFFMKSSETVDEVVPIHSLYESPQLIHLLEARKWDAVEKKLKLIFSHLELENYHFQEFVMEAYFMISNSFTYIAHKNGQLLINIIGPNFNRMVEAVHSGTLLDLKMVTFEILTQIKEGIKQEISSNHMPVIEEVQDFVENNLSLDISLQMVADHVYLHPAYLSKIYKGETGEGFSEFLCRKKMEKAADLLKNSKQKIYEISMDLGYKDTSYFIRKFKKHFGITPQEYRQI